MTRSLVILCLLLMVPVDAGAAGIRDYQLTIRTDAAGAGEAVLRVVVYNQASVVRIPVGYPGVGDVRITEGPAGATVSSEPAGSQTTLVLGWQPGVQGDVAVTVTFRVPSVVPEPVVKPGERPTLPQGSRTLKHAFVNTEAGAIDRYLSQVLFPPGLRAHAVREALPKLRGAEAGPRVRLGSVDAWPAATLEVTALKQGDSASMHVELTPQGRSWAWLVVGALLSALYLFYFRDLVARRAA